MQASDSLRARALPRQVRRVPDEKIAQGADLVIAIGGDGSMLYAARRIAGRQTPLLGINRGRLGFLADVGPEHMLARVDEVLAGKYVSEQRMLLLVDLHAWRGHRGQRHGAQRRGGQAARHRPHVRVPDLRRRAATSTPTLATASSSPRRPAPPPTRSAAAARSSNPSLDALLLMPICPHTLSDRPLVIPATRVAEVRLRAAQSEHADVSCDGELVGQLGPGGSIRVRAARERIELIHPVGYDYFGILRSKLLWGRDARDSTPIQPSRAGRWWLVLRELHIRDLAVIEAVAIELGPGFTTLTGETGAGKSILIDALALALGERGDAQAIRSGAERLEVSATFDTADNPPPAAGCSKTSLATKPATAYCVAWSAATAARAPGSMARPVPVQTLRELGALLVDICGQQDYQSLRHKNTQREVLDSTGDTLRPARRGARSMAQLESRRRGTTGNCWHASRTATAGVNCSPSRSANCRRSIRARANTRKSNANIAHCTTAHRSPARCTRHWVAPTTTTAAPHRRRSLRHARHSTRCWASIRGSGQPCRLLTEADIQIREAADLIRQRIDTLDQDPARESELDDRLAALQEAAASIAVTPDELPALQVRLSAELEQLGNYAESCSRLASVAAEKRSAARTSWLPSSAASAARRLQSLAQAITQNMATLGMAGGRFEVRIRPLPDAAIGPDGADDIEFLVSANPGQPPAAMSRVASGGELSRLNLAIQVVATATHGAPTLIFDEVDAGVGGAVAEIVGRKLRELSRQRQVLCVTHLPQVAAQASQHFTVRKQAARGKTSTSVAETRCGRTRGRNGANAGRPEDHRPDAGACRGNAGRSGRSSQQQTPRSRRPAARARLDEAGSGPLTLPSAAARTAPGCDRPAHSPACGRSRAAAARSPRWKTR